MSSSYPRSAMLVTLPREIRDLILTYAFSPPFCSNATEEQIDNLECPAIIMNFLYRAYDHKTHLECLPDVSQASMQLYCEATPLWLARATIEVTGLQSLHWTRSWFERLGSQAFDRVPELIFSDPDASNFDAYRDFMVRFKNLQRLQILIPTAHLPVQEPDGEIHVQTIIDTYKLETIAQIGSLKRLSFEFPDGDAPCYGYPPSRHLRSYFAERFEVQGMEVEIDRGYRTEDEDEEVGSDDFGGCAWFD